MAPSGSARYTQVPSCPGPASLLMPLAEEGPRTSRRGARVVWRENAHDASCRLQDARGPGPRHGQTVAHWSPGPCPATTGLGRQSRASGPGGADARSSPPPHPHGGHRHSGAEPPFPEAPGARGGLGRPRVLKA
uniref:Uncharacterized protein n=1 Tax=Rousettus aegyptiacus TaxID=9407 RepID=A0A7J8IMW0_ROUAE|nr:hypothetical protein HJG63_010480 [Rousettus aegyptiacus]